MIYHDTITCSLYINCSPIFIISRKLYVVYKQLFNCSWRKATAAEDQVSYNVPFFFTCTQIPYHEDNFDKTFKRSDIFTHST